MKVFANILALVGCTSALLAGGQEGALLDYQLKVRTGQDAIPLETAFRVVTTPALVTRNRVKQPRMGGWRIEPEPGSVAPTPALMARALGLCYFSGPTSQVVPLATGMRLGNRWCRLWQVQIPSGVGVYAYLAEVAPNLLALSYLSATLPGGEVRSLEIHLARVSLGSRVSPAEEGTALLNTLQHWPVRIGNQDQDQDPDVMETEAVP